MQKVSYLIAPVVTLALFVLSCSQEAPTASSANEIVPKTDAPTVSGVDEVGSQLTHGLEENPIGSCCPTDFFLVEAGPGNPANVNGDDSVCRKFILGGARFIEIDNSPGLCDCIPPNCD